MGSFNGIGTFAGGMQESLEDLIVRKMKQADQEAQIRNMEAQRALQAQGLEQQARGIGVQERRLGEDARQYDTTRSDKLTAEQTERDAATKAASDAEAFEQTLPGHLRTVFHAGGHKANFKPDEVVNAPETREQADAREIANYGKKNQITVAGQLRVASAQNAARAAAKNTPGVGEDYTNERHARVLQSVDELDKKISNWTAGAGSLLANVPGTVSRNFAAELNTLKSNIAFNELTEMRAASKTGGALGAVSDKEGKLLESALGALDQGQSPENLRAQLQKIKGSIQRWENAKAGSALPPMNVVGGSGFKVVEIK